MSSVSVVIPSRNGLQLLLRQLPILFRDDGIEIIVVDDCSKDGTGEALRSAFPEVRLLVRTGTPGFCHAVNLGMKAATREFLLLLNNDVAPEPGCLSGMENFLKGSPADLAVVVPVITRPDGTDDGALEWGFRHGLAFTGRAAGSPYPSGACALWRRSAWSSLGGLSPRYAPIYWEDVDMGVRLNRAGLRMARYDGPGVFHDHAATMGSSISSMSLRERNRFVFMKTWCRTPPMRAQTAAWLPFHLVAALIRGNRPFLRGFRDYMRLADAR